MTDVTLQQPRRRRPRKRVILGVVGAVFALATFAYFLPKIADYRDVWAVIKGLSWEWIAALVAVTLLNLATFAPPWQAALPGLRYRAAFVLTQVSTALSLVVPGGAAPSGCWEGPFPGNSPRITPCRTPSADAGVP